LAFLFRLLGSVTPLLGQEVGQVDVDASGWARHQVIGRRLVLVFFVLKQLGLDHFDLLPLLLLLDPEFVLLLGSHVCLQKIHVVRVAAEHAFVVHDVEGFALIGVLLIVEAGSVRVFGLRLVLGLAAENLGLRTLEGLLRHILFL
jgi:hypothetical protein